MFCTFVLGGKVETSQRLMFFPSSRELKLPTPTHHMMWIDTSYENGLISPNRYDFFFFFFFFSCLSFHALGVKAWKRTGSFDCRLSFHTCLVNGLFINVVDVW
eukprot:TRINITY_DN9313_c0_g1_i5.p1 TRINITY_DN9313_c0_g1~~TRINITY_DN9313_c0_g1_i5.p1  ORF type:complete len:103 (-),score=14.07 TRINITY_DN9313_c0_g1_i5:118-426(-)